MGYDVNKSLELRLSRRIDKDEMISFISSDPDAFEAAIQIATRHHHSISWRAAWLLGHCIRPNDPRLYNHLNAFIQAIKQADDGHQRELIKILEKMELTKEQQGRAFDQCIMIWEAANKKPSTRIVAFRLLQKVSNDYPELIRELEYLTQEHYLSTLTPGARASLKKMLRQ